jgi:hopanoid biosynthesis associated radical SAM protein HpnH
MALQPQLVLTLSRYLLAQKLKGVKRYPFALMIEPTHRCNLFCAGCGRIREHHDTMDQALSAQECLAASDESGAPVACVAGGEPLLHPEIGQIINGLVARRRFVNLSTNGLLLKQSLHKFAPSVYLNINVHVDGMASTHDRLVGRPGTFATAIEAITAAKEAGFRVCTNTTVYKGTDPAEIVELFSLLMDRGVDSVIVSPAFSYEAVENDIFLSREEIHRQFQAILSQVNGVRWYNTPPYLEFLTGARELSCSPWSTPTRTPQGWQHPCYLLNDGYCSSFQELMETTDWDRFGPGRDPRCANCKVHSGFEASSVSAMAHPSVMLKSLVWGIKP